MNQKFKILRLYLFWNKVKKILKNIYIKLKYIANDLKRILK